MLMMDRVPKLAKFPGLQRVFILHPENIFSKACELQ